MQSPREKQKREIRYNEFDMEEARSNGIITGFLLGVFSIVITVYFMV